MAMMEAMAFLDVRLDLSSAYPTLIVCIGSLWRRLDNYVKAAGVEQPVGGVQHPDRQEHGKYESGVDMDVVRGRDEPGPHRCHGGGVERQQMPKGQASNRDSQRPERSPSS